MVKCCLITPRCQYLLSTMIVVGYPRHNPPCVVLDVKHRLTRGLQLWYTSMVPLLICHTRNWPVPHSVVACFLQCKHSPFEPIFCNFFTLKIPVLKHWPIIFNTDHIFCIYILCVNCATCAIFYIVKNKKILLFSAFPTFCSLCQLKLSVCSFVCLSRSEWLKILVQRNLRLPLMVGCRLYIAGVKRRFGKEYCTFKFLSFRSFKH